jgi:hypothetical protein
MKLDCETMTNKIFKFKKEIGWGELIALIAIGISLYTFYFQIQLNRPEIFLKYDKVIGCFFPDKDKKRKFFCYNRAIISNNGQKATTLVGLKPAENVGLLFVKERGAQNINRQNTNFKIFQIPDSIMSGRLISNGRNLWDFQDQGLERLSLLNQKIEPGQVFILNIGVIVDAFSDTSKQYEVIFVSQLEFSDGSKHFFGFGTQY